MKRKSFIIHRTSRVVIVATGRTTNRKTGDMVQIWILDARMHPADSRRSGADAKNQCRGCPLASNKGCYVTPMPLMAIWRSLETLETLEMGSAEWRKYFGGRVVRFGAYGNPSMIPFRMLESIASLASGRTGYFHDWHLMKPERAQRYGRYLMASCEPHTQRQAQSLGLRTFTTHSGDQTPENGLECLADSHGLSCAKCKLCDGTARPGRKPNVWITVHGYQKRLAETATLSS